MGCDVQMFIQDVIEGRHLTHALAQDAFEHIMDGNVSNAQISALLVALQMNGVNEDELAGAVEAIRNKMVTIEAPDGAVDTCGTGGDLKGSLNISTAVAFVVAACGVPVVKHGNRSVSSKSGSSDVLAALGVNLDAPKAVLEQALHECNICFMMAPNFHPAMRHVAPVRKELGIRTIFNLIGPLVNPASPRYQLLGVYHKDLCELMAKTLKATGTRRAWVVHGKDGMDELTLTDVSYVTKLDGANITSETLDPRDYGFEFCSPEALLGGTPDENAQAIREIFSGSTGPYRDIALFNAAATLVIAGKTDELAQGIALAKNAIDSGAAKKALESLANITQTSAEVAAG